MTTVDPSLASPRQPIGVSVHRTLVSAALFCFFVLAYVAAPYWLLAESTTEKLVFLVSTVLLGYLWVRLASADLRLELDRRGWIIPAALVLVLGLLNARALTSAIPWRGDESAHIAFALTMATMIPLAWALAAILVVALVLYVAWRKPRYAWPACAILAAGCAAAYLLREPTPLYQILRYPAVSRWFHAVTPMLLRPITGLYHEILYRIVPFVSTVLLCFRFARNAESRSTVLKLALGVAAATIPTVFYYSSILYLEMPAVFLMFVACSEIDPLLRLRFRDLSEYPAWYALILIGFIKETAVVFLVAFVLCRIAVRLKAASLRAVTIRALLEELWVAVCVLLPAFVYLFFRRYFGDPRQFQFNPANLLSRTALRVILVSYLQQFGLGLLAFVGGLVVLFKKKRYGAILFLVVTVVSFPLFHLIDTLEYAGYSRFNLFALPSLLAGSAVLVQFLSTRRRWLLPALIVLTIGGNVLMSPVNLDGTKKPYWGNELVDTSEHYYPYPEALAWLKAHRDPESVLFAGLHFGYYFEFYFHRLDWHPEYELLDDPGSEEVSALEAMLQAASERGITSVVYRVDPRRPQELDRVPEGWEQKLFSNMAHSLAVYVSK